MSMCPSCGEWNTRTAATRRDTRHNWVWRRKQCNECGYKFETYEIPTDCVTEPDEWVNPNGKLVK